MHPHRVDILDRADHDEVVGHIAHDLELEFFPPDDGFLDENLVNRARLQAAFGNLPELLDVVRNTGTHASECEGGTDDGWEPKLAHDGLGLGVRARIAAGRDGDVDRSHRVAKLQAILRQLDRLRGSTNEPHVVLVERAVLGKRNGQVQRRLPSNRGQQRIGPLLLNDARQCGGRERLDIGSIREFGVRHDRGRIAVDQNHLKAFSPEGLASLDP